MNIYELGDTWIAAKNLRDAVREAESTCDFNRREAIEDAVKLGDADLDRYQFIDDPYNPEQSTKRSFRAQLEKMIAEGERFPCPFACRDY